jgi:oligoribonuclease NrnB/cAMP/cGMP phosphodiesterase (DHH superfamily)
MKIFYHNDDDGKASARVVYTNLKKNGVDDALLKERAFIEVNHSTDFPKEKIDGDSTVYIVDLSFTEKTYKDIIWILEYGTKVVWIDHHKSSNEALKLILEEIKDKPELINNFEYKIETDTKKAAVLLTFEYFAIKNNKHINSIRPSYIDYISDYDTWSYKHAGTANFILGIDSDIDGLHPLKSKVWEEFENVCSTKDIRQLYLDNKWIEKGETIKNYIDSKNTQYRESYMYESVYEGIICAVINNKTNSWIFGDCYEKYPFVVVWVFDGKQYIYSLYSNNANVDCSEIVKKLSDGKGGGHKGAAGFRSNHLIFKAK